MIGAFATWLIVGSLLLAAAALVTTLRKRAMGVALLVGLGLLEIALLVQAGMAIVKLIGGETPKETPTFVGYLVGTLAIPIFAAFWGMAERTRWGAAVVAVACFAIPVMTGRLLQLWQGTA